jgi:hypothetical protein
LQGVLLLLAQAKNGDQLFWEEKFHAANGLGQACTQGALHFFSPITIISASLLSHMLWQMLSSRSHK